MNQGRFQGFPPEMKFLLVLRSPRESKVLVIVKARETSDPTAVRNTISKAAYQLIEDIVLNFQRQVVKWKRSKE